MDDRWQAVFLDHDNNLIQRSSDDGVFKRLVTAALAMHKDG